MAELKIIFLITSSFGEYSSELVGGWEDWEFWISMLKNGGQVYKIKTTGFYYRIHQNSRQKSTTKESEMQTEYYINNKHHDFIFRLIQRPFKIKQQKRMSIWAKAVLSFLRGIYSKNKYYESQFQQSDSRIQSSMN